MCTLLLLLAGCTKEGETLYKPDPADIGSSSPLVAVIYDPDALGDLTYNDLIYTGVERAALKNGLRTMQLSPRSRQEGLAYLSSMMEQMCAGTDTVRRLLIVAGASYDEYVRANNSRLEGHPRSDLLYFETTEPLQGKGSSVHINFYGAMYEAGAVSSAFADEALIVAANPHITSITDAVQGFRDGFGSNWVGDPDARKIFMEYLSDAPGSGFSVDDSTAIRLMYSQPWTSTTQLIVPICGGASNTFKRLAENTNTFKVVGMDRALRSSTSFYSAVKHSDNAVELCIGQWLSAQGMPKHQTLGLADGYTGLEYNPASSTFYYTLEALLPEQKRNDIHQDAIERESQYGNR